jgi:hypothetical protein
LAAIDVYNVQGVGPLYENNAQPDKLLIISPYDETEDTAGELRLRSNNRSASLRRAAGEVQRALGAFGHISTSLKVGFAFCGEDKPLKASAAILEALSETKSKRTLASFLGELLKFVFDAFLAKSSIDSTFLRFRLADGDFSPLDITRFNVEFHRFLMALSVRPGRRFAISAHLLPSSACVSMII